MTINEAIVHAREVASEQKRRSGECATNDNECDKFSTCIKCAEEHEQLAEWLEELKSIKEEIGTDEWIREHDRLIRNKAIDDFANTLKQKYSCLGYIDVLAESDIDEIAEQLKAGDCD